MFTNDISIFPARLVCLLSFGVLSLGCSDYNFEHVGDKNYIPDSAEPDVETEVEIEDPPPDCSFEGYPAGDIPVDETCFVEAIVGTWTPVIEWTNTAPGNTYTTPVVGDLNGDNIPDIVVGNSGGTTYAMSGDTGQQLWSAGYLGSEPMTPAIADINNDGINDVVSAGSTGVEAYNGTDGSVLWSTSQVPNGNTPQCGAVGIHDLDGDGSVEIVLGNLILNGIDGSFRGMGAHGSGAGHAWAAPMGVAADVLRNGSLQVVVGNALYDSYGNTIWHNGQSDGFVAIGQFDSDAEGEIVVARTGTLRLQDHDGTVLWTLPGLTGSTIGPPTVADFNNDGEPEIGVAGNGVYIVVDKNGSTLWSRSVQDYSSGFTGSAVFDFEGDGAAEVVYADENDLWVFDGATGSVKLQETRHSSATCSEYPAIADVDNDGHAEIIYTSSSYSGPETGVTVIGDSNDSWVPGRPIWNQHAYFMTNIENDGSVPPLPDVNWDQYNTFRSGDSTAGLGGFFPDLIAEIDDVCTDFCDMDLIYVSGRIGNQGLTEIIGNVSVELRAITPSGYVPLHTESIAGPFLPGRITPTFTFVAHTGGHDIYGLDLLVDKGDLDEGDYYECNESNDQASWMEAICP